MADESCPMCGGPAGRSRRVVRAGMVTACTRCGGWYRIPRPLPQDLERIYTKDYYDAWGLGEDQPSVEATKRATFGPLLDRIEEAVGSTKRRRLLDVGAATGVLLHAAAERGWEPYALEVNPYSAGILREKFGADHVFERELFSLPSEPASFEVITMTDVIEHVLDIRATLAQAARLLTCRGVLCITTPRVDSLSRRLLGRQWLHFKEEHLQYFSRRGITNSMVAAGFRDIAVRRHYKRLTIAYLRQQLRTFRHPLLTPVIAGIYHMLPHTWRAHPIPLSCGEMLVLARTRTVLRR